MKGTQARSSRNHVHVTNLHHVTHVERLQKMEQIANGLESHSPSLANHYHSPDSSFFFKYFRHRVSFPASQIPPKHVCGLGGEPQKCKCTCRPWQDLQEQSYWRYKPDGLPELFPHDHLILTSGRRHNAPGFCSALMPCRQMAVDQGLLSFSGGY